MAIAPRLDDTDPALPALRLEAFPYASPSLIVLTRDPQLVETLRNVATGHAVAAVSAETELAGQLMQAQGGVALIDAAAVVSPVTSLTERLKAQFPDLVLVVAGSSEDQGALTPQITRGTVYRFLHKPLSEQRVKLFVAAAWRRHGEEHSGIVGAARTQATHTLPAAKPRRGLWIAVAVLVCAAAGWFLLRQPRSDVKTAPVLSTVPALAQSTSAPAPERDSIGAITREAGSQPDSVAQQPPPGAQATTIAPAPIASRTSERAATQVVPPTSITPAATDTTVPRPRPSAPASSFPSTAAAPSLPETAPSALAARIVSETHNALDEGKLDEAERLIQIAAEAGVDEEDLDDLVRKARELRIAARGAAMTRDSQHFNERMAQGRLLEPANDSAKHFLAALVATDADHPSTRIAKDAFASRLVQEARNMGSGEDLAAARRWLVEARAAGADESAIVSVENEISNRQEAAAKADEVVNSATLTKLKHVDPEYPQAARMRNVDGWVDLELTVQTDGSAGQVIVMRADPADIFDKAAMDAVRQWRYEPVQRNGKAVEQRTRVRIRFQLQ